MEIVIHKALTKDANILFILNEKFNGVGCTSVELLEESLESNAQEVVFIATVDGFPAGFCCVQLFKSMCYSSNYVEITELFVDEVYRRTGVATSLMQTVENYFKDYNIGGFQLFTGGKNHTAQTFYEKNGYVKTDEIMYRKRRKTWQK